MKIQRLTGLWLTLVTALGWLVFSKPQAPQESRVPQVLNLKPIETLRSAANLDSARPSPPTGTKAQDLKPVLSPIEPDAATKTRVQSVLGKLPLYFIENQGQFDDRVAYYLQGRTSSVYFSAEGLTYALTSENKIPSVTGLLHRTSVTADAGSGAAPRRWALKLNFVGGNPKIKPKGQDPTQAVVSYFKGPREQWKSGVKTYGRVVYEDLWPGIDLIYNGTGNRLKYTFIVKPGADPDQIKLVYRGATSVRLTESGQMAVTTPIGGFSDDGPVAWQDDNKRHVDVAYSLQTESGGDYAYGFRVGKYDRSKPLVLDPVVLVYSSYLGGAGSDGACCLAVDGQGNAYVAGRTNSDQTTFPETVGPDAIFNGGSFDAFVAKVNMQGTGLVYAGYIGGAGDDEALGIALEQGCVDNCSAYVTGFTDSTQTSFPVTTGSLDTIHNGGRDAFVAKVNAAGTALVYCGYIGGNGSDQGNGIAVDDAGNAYVTGTTNSTQTTFPVTAGSLDTTYNGGSFDAFVAKVKADGTGLVYAGYIGGNGDDEALGIALQLGCGSDCSTFLTGFTTSGTGFPVSVGPDFSFNGGVDAFVAKVKADGSGLDYGGFIGGTGTDFGLSIAVDSSGNAYIMGYTGSNDFKVFFLHPIQPPGGNLGPNRDAYFIVKVDSIGSELLNATLLSGSPVEFSGASTPGHIAVDSAGNVYVTGRALSNNFPVTVDGAFQPTFGGGFSDAFVAKLDLTEGVILYSTFLGGSGGDSGTGIAVDASGAVYVAGSTTSVDFPTIPGVFQTSLGGGSGSDAFVVKLSGGDVPLQFVTFPPDLPSLPTIAVFGEGYSGNIGIGGGLPPFGVSKTEGSLPDGLNFASPAIHGTPTGQTGMSPFTVQVQDLLGIVLEGQFDLTICLTEFAVFTRHTTVTVGESQPFVACGGVGVKTFSIPANNSGATITPAGKYTAGSTSGVTDTVRVTDTANGDFKELSVQVVPALQISPTEVTVIAGTSQNFIASGGVGNKKFSFLKDKSKGNIDPVTGLYTAGLTAGVTDSVRVKDENGNRSDATVNVLQPGPLSLAASPLPDAETNVPYNVPLISGGIPPYTHALTKGIFPLGLAFDPASGDLFGVPASAKTVNFTIQITDSQKNSVDGKLKVKVFKELRITTSALKAGKIGKNYNATLKASGGKTPYTRSLGSNPPLESALGFDDKTGKLTGRPTVAATYNLVLTVTDPLGGNDSKNFTLTVSP